MSDVDSIRITVCAECLRACCWQGEFMCEKARGANITVKTVGELKALQGQIDGEHPEWWANAAGLNDEERAALKRDAAPSPRGTSGEGGR